MPLEVPTENEDGKSKQSPYKKCCLEQLSRVKVTIEKSGGCQPQGGGTRCGLAIMCRTTLGSGSGGRDSKGEIGGR